MKLYLLTLIFCSTLIYTTAQNEGNVEFEVGGKPDKTNIEKLYATAVPDDSESGDGSSGSGIDDTESSGEGSGEEEEGSGAITPTDSIVASTKEVTAKHTTQQPLTSQKSTVEIINEGTTEETTTTTTTTVKKVISNEIDPSDGETTSFNNVGAVSGSKPTPKSSIADEPGTVNFTVGIIVGVVVGAILAILVIVFLVYRLRKKDEGSYSLDEPSTQAFIRDEKTNPGQGKEYFA